MVAAEGDGVGAEVAVGAAVEERAVERVFGVVEGGTAEGVGLGLIGAHGAAVGAGAVEGSPATFGVLDDEDVQFAGGVEERPRLAGLAEGGLAGEVDGEEAVADGPTGVGGGLGETAEGCGGGEEVASSGGHVEIVSEYTGGTRG